MLQKQASPDIQKDIKELRKVIADRKTAANREAELKANLLAYMDNSPGAIKDKTELLALIKEKVRTGIDATLLKTNYPEAAEACTKSSTYLQVECC